MSAAQDSSAPLQFAAAQKSLDLLQQIVDKHPSSALAVTLSSGGSVGDVNLQSLRTRVSDLQRAMLTRTSGLPMQDWLNGVVTLSDGFLFVGKRSDPKSVNGEREADGWYAKTDLLGTTVWDHRLDYRFLGELRTATVLASGDVLVGGDSASGSYDGAMYRVSSEGSLTDLGIALRNQKVMKSASLPDGGYVLATGTLPSGSTNVVRFDADNEEVWRSVVSNLAVPAGFVTSGDKIWLAGTAVGATTSSPIRLLASLNLEDGQLALKAMGPGAINSVVKLATGEIALGGARLNGDIGNAWIAVLNEAAEIIAEPALDSSYNQVMALAPLASGEVVAAAISVNTPTPASHALVLDASRTVSRELALGDGVILGLAATPDGKIAGAGMNGLVGEDQDGWFIFDVLSLGGV